MKERRFTLNTMLNLFVKGGRRLLSGLFAIVSLIALSGCNVHEWPEETGETYDFTLTLDFNTDLPLHKEVYYTRDGEARAIDNDFDIRYIVNIYDVADENDGNRNVVTQYTFTRSFSENPDYTIRLQLTEGRYRFRVWADYVEAGSKKDKFYVTSDFTEIKLDESVAHYGNTERRDAFRGSAYAEVVDPLLYSYTHGGAVADNNVVVSMHRPMGRYEFISTDMDEFLDKEVRSRAAALMEGLLTKGPENITRDDVAETIGLDKYKVVFSYNAFMPSSYNHYTDKPSDSSTGIRYEASMSLGEDGIRLGFDYILVDQETTMNLNLAVYNPEGQLIANTSGVEVPIARSKNTIVKGSFLTVSSGGGVTINPDFEGDDFNIEIH